MKKMKKSLKYVLISLSLVFVIAAISVAAVFIFRKPTAQEVQFSEQQQILLDKISNSNQALSASQNKTMLEMVSLVDESGVQINNDTVHAIYDDYFIALDESGNKIVYKNSDSGCVNLFEKMQNNGQLDDGEYNLSVEKIKGDYILYSYSKDVLGDTLKVFELADFSSPAFDVVVKNSLYFKTDESGNLCDDAGNLIFDIEFVIYDEYFNVFYSKITKTSSYAEELNQKYIKQIYAIAADGSSPSQVFEYNSKDEFLSVEAKSADEKVFVRTFEDGSATFAYLKDSAYKTYSYRAEEGFSYNFYPTNLGIFVEKQRVAQLGELDDAVMVDGVSYIYSYEFFDIKTEEVKDYQLGSGAAKASFASIDEFVIVFEQSKESLTLSDSGTITYLNAAGEKVVSYAASSISSTIKYSNNVRFVTDDGIFETKKNLDAECVFDFSAEGRNYALVSENIDSDYFVVRDKTTTLSYFLSTNGEIFNNESFVSFKELGEGYFLTFVNGKNYLCSPKENKQILIENYQSFYGAYLLKFGIYLTEEDGGLYSLFGSKGEIIESDVSLEVIARENYFALIASKDGYTKTYCLKNGGDYDGTVFDYSKERITDSYEILSDNATSYADETAAPFIVTGEYLYKSVSVTSGGTVTYSYPSKIKITRPKFTYYEGNSVITRSAVSETLVINNNNGELSYGGEIGTLTLTKMYSVVGEDGYIKFDYSINLGDFVNPSDISIKIDATETSYYQPQAAIDFKVYLKKFTPYGSRAVEELNLDYFNTTNESTNTSYSPSAAHYIFNGWQKGATYYLNSSVSPLENFAGSALGVHWNNAETIIELYPIWTGEMIKILFFSWADEDENKLTYSSQYVKEKENAFVNVEPFLLHSTILKYANEINNPNNSVIQSPEIKHTGWEVCSFYLPFTSLTYDDYTKPSGTFLSDSIHTVCVYATYSSSSSPIEVVGTQSNQSSWQEAGDVSANGVSGSYNKVAKGYADKATTRWHYSGEDWVALSSKQPSFWGDTKLYLDLNIFVKGADGTKVTNPYVVEKYYTFGTITFDIYNGVTAGSSPEETIVFVYNQSTNTYTTSSSSSFIKIDNDNSLASRALFLINEGTFGKSIAHCKVSIGELVPAREDVNKSTTGDDLNVLGDYSSTAVFNVGSAKENNNGKNEIVSSNGDKAYYSSRYFSDGVDINDYYNNTHMLVIRPKSSYLSQIIDDGYDSLQLDRKITATYMSNLTATVYHELHKESYDNTMKENNVSEYENQGTNGTKYSISGLKMLSLDYHSYSTYFVEISSGNTIAYNGLVYDLISVFRVNNKPNDVDYAMRFDIYIGKSSRVGAVSPYEDEYAYFIFYNGKIKFDITMKEIDFGSLEVDLSSTGELNKDTVDGGYVNYTNYVEPIVFTMDDSGNIVDTKLTSGSVNNISSLLIDKMTGIALDPVGEFLISEVTISLTPQNSALLGTMSRTYKLNFDDNKQPAVVMSDASTFSKIRYTYEDTPLVSGGVSYYIQDLCNLQFASIGDDMTGDDAWFVPTDSYSVKHGSVWIGLSKLVDSVTISYKVISYFDVLLRQFKYMDVNSYLRKPAYNANEAFNKSYYQSDFYLEDGNKSGTWFNNTTLSKIYITGSPSNVIISNESAFSHADNYYNRTRQHMAAYKGGSEGFIYEDVPGYTLNTNTYFSVGTGANELTLVALKDFITDDYLDSQFSMSLYSIKINTYENGIFNINKAQLSHNAITANYYADPIKVTLSYGDNEETIYYDDSYQLNDNSIIRYGYTFVGWVSKPNSASYVWSEFATADNAACTYDTEYGGYLFTNEEAMATVIGSAWYHNRDGRGFHKYFEGASIEEENLSDFYIDGANFVTDTGLYDTQKYNFWAIYDSSFKADGTGTINLYPVWMANDYVLKFDLNDSESDADGSQGSTKTLFRLNDTSFSKLSSVYNQNLNNGFNFELSYASGLDQRLKLIATDGVDTSGGNSTFFAYVRFGTTDWYFSDINSDRTVYYQKFFPSSGSNVDRYGYVLGAWSVGGNSFDGAVKFDETFYEKANAVLQGGEINITFDYVGSTNAESVSNKKVYTYGANGAEFDSERFSDDEYLGAKVDRFLTHANSNYSKSRIMNIEASWDPNQYEVRVMKDFRYFNFADDLANKVVHTIENLKTKIDYYSTSKTYAFDSEELVEVLKCKPYRRGYDFAGWTFGYNDDAENKGLMSEANENYLNYWYEQLEYDSAGKSVRTYKWLSEDLLLYYNYYKEANISETDLSKKITNILNYDTGSASGSELLGDADKGAKSHYINLYANWTPMIYRIDIDLNIPVGYEDYSNEVFAGFFPSGTTTKVLDSNGLFVDGVLQNGFKFNDNAIASFNYMINEDTYKGLISNIALKVQYGQTFENTTIEYVYDAYDGDGNFIGTNTLSFDITDLYVSINNQEFAGWKLFGLEDDGNFEFLTSGKIKFTNKYYEAFITDWRKVSNYGEVTIGGERIKVQRDYVAEYNGGAYEIRQRLYAEHDGKRYYLTGADKIMSDGVANTLIDFDETGISIIVGGKKYKIYSNAEGGYYVKKGTDSNIFSLTAAQKSAITNSAVITDYTADDSKTFTFKAVWNELSNAQNITASNANNSSTGLFYYNGAYQNIYAKETSSGYLLYVDNKLIDFYYFDDLDGGYYQLIYDGEYLTCKGYRIVDVEGGVVAYQDTTGGYITNVEMNKYNFFYRVTTGSGSLINFNMPSSMHHFTGDNDNANPGLGGIYEVETDAGTIVSDNEIVDNLDGTYTQNGNKEYSFDYKFDYGEDVIMNILPYYNGRYLTELAFEFDVLINSNHREAIDDLSKIEVDRFRLVFNLFFDSDNRKIGIESVRLHLVEFETEFAMLVRKSDLLVEDYLTWWKHEDMCDASLSHGYDDFAEIIERYLPCILPELEGDNFITASEYIDLSSGGTAIYGRHDVNKVTLELTNLKQEINIKAKFAVQTYDMNLYSLLNNTYDAQINTEGEGIDTPYTSIYDLEADIDSKYATISENYLSLPDSGLYPKFVTIKTDIDGNAGLLNETKVETHNVPYGFFAYGYRISSNYVGDRPIDQDFVKNPVYGYEHIYSNGSYTYAGTSLSVNAENSDLVNSSESSGLDYSDESNKYLAQNALVFGNSEKFAQSIRADKELIYYNFGGLFFIDYIDEEDGVKFKAVNEADEKTPLNKNMTVYAYYYITTSATDAGFFAWDDVSQTYKRLEDSKSGYAYQKVETLENYYIINADNTVSHITGKPSGNAMYAYEEIGIDTEKFANDFVGLKTFATSELKEEYMQYLKFVSQTYWFIARGETELGISLDTVGLKYDKAKDLFYYGSDYYALQHVRDSDQTYYGATLYKKSSFINGFYEIVEDLSAYNPATDDLDDYAIFTNYYILYDGEYYKIEYYSKKQGSEIYYNPYQKHDVSNEGINSGNKVVIPVDDGTGTKVAKTYYFDYETMKLYEPDMLGVEVADISYKIVTAINPNYNIDVAERENGYGLCDFALKSIPDASVGYWMAGTEFLFWAGISVEDFNKLLEYEAGGGEGDGKIYTSLMNKFKETNPSEENLEKFTAELNGKVSGFSFEALIKPGILVKGFTNNDDGLVERVELQFVVDMWFESVSQRVTVNVSEEFDVLTSGADMTSSIFAVQVYQRTGFKVDWYEKSKVDSEYKKVSVKVKGTDIRFFRYEGDTIKYYDPADCLGLSLVSDSHYNELKNASDKVSAMQEIISLYGSETKYNYDESNDVYELNFIYYAAYCPVVVVYDKDDNGNYVVLDVDLLI